MVNTDALTFEVTDVADNDAPPAESADETPSLSDFEYACEVCGVELFYAGRGRKPKRCEEHKARSASAARGKAGVNAGRWQQPLADALTSQFAMIGIAVYPLNQFDGTCILNGAPGLSTALVGVAETNPAVRNALQKFVSAGAWAQVASATAAIVLPILMNHNVIPPIKIPGMTPVA